MSVHLIGLAVVFASLSLSACAALFGTSLTPQEQACMRRSMENVPDLTGTWETNTGERLALQPDPGRKTSVRAQLTADSKAPNPRWVIEGVYLQWPRNPTPQSEECGSNWTMSVRQTFPDRKPGGPGQFVSLTDNRTATLSTDFNSISFGGNEVWRRVGATVGELKVPKAGELTTGMAMEGPTLARVSGSREIDCVAQCRSNRRCAAMVFHGDVCTTLSKLGRVTSAGGTSTWINPGFDSRPPPPLPGPGRQVDHIRVTGEPFKTVGLGDRAGPWKCAKACDEDWTCRAYAFERWGGKCELLRKATAAEYAEGWVSGAMGAPTAQLPEHGAFAQDTRLSGATRRTLSFAKEQKSAVGHECRKACEADEGCKAVSYGPNAECELKGAALGDAQPAKGWTSWRAPLPPPDTSRPPDQTMTSHLCKNHGDAFPARFLTTDVLPPSGDYAPRFVEVPGMVPNGWGPSPTGDLQVRYPAKPEPKIRSMGFYPRPLPDGTVHFHTFYQPDVVLKRKDGDVIAGAPDAHSAWRIEHLFEHADPPANGVWYVIRSPDTGMFLAARNGRLVLVGNPDSLDARWRFDFAVLPAEAGREFIELTVKEPPRLILDQGALNRLTDWAVKEYYRQEQPACWKKGGSGDCPSGQDTNCGLFCAKSTEMCVMEVTEMVVSVGELAANIAGVVFTAGTANVALKAARTAGAGAKLGMRQFMRTAGRAIKNKLHDRLGARVMRFVKSRGKSESFKKLARDVAKQTAIQTGKLTAKEAMSSAADAYLEREQARHADNLAEAYAREVSRMAAEKIALQAAAGDNPDWLAIAAMVDPTGVMAVVDAYHKPMCEETPMPDVTF